MPLPNLAGEKCTTVTGLVDGTAYVRLLRYLPGGTLVGAGYLSPDGGRRPGRGGGPGEPGAGRLQPSRPGPGPAVGSALRRTTSSTQLGLARRRPVASATGSRPRPRGAWSRIAPLADDLPRQAVHLDLTDANVVVSRIDGGAARPDGVIDFGDLSDTWAVSELAITAVVGAGARGRRPDLDAARRSRAFHAIRPLSAAEVDALWPLLVLRTAVLIVSGAQQAVLDPDNDYLTDQSDDERRMFEQATSVPIDVMTAVIRAELGLADHPGSGDGRRRSSPAWTRPRWSRWTCRPPPSRTTTPSRRRVAADRHRGRIGQGRSARRRDARRHPVRRAAAEPGARS